MPVKVERCGKKYCLVEADTGKRATNKSGTPVDGEGHDSEDKAAAQARAINASLHRAGKFSADDAAPDPAVVVFAGHGPKPGPPPVETSERPPKTYHIDNNPHPDKKVHMMATDLHSSVGMTMLRGGASAQHARMAADAAYHHLSQMH